jgi:uncharacterized repeat protein (TIGR03803 family)
MRMPFARALLGAFGSLILSCCAGSPPAGVPPITKTAGSHGRLVRPHAQFTLMHSFQARQDGAAPLADLTLVNGSAYGTTSAGGTSGSVCACGTVFSIDGSGAYHVISRFKGTYSRKIGQIGADGARPKGGLLYSSGTFYGTTFYGGDTGLSSPCSAQVNSGCGTVYSVDAAGRRRTLYRFQSGADGEGPIGDLVALNGKFYGVTARGGLGGHGYTCGSCGTIYEIDSRARESVIYSFTGDADSDTPQAGLTIVNGTLYGTATGGGSCSSSLGCGSVFTVTPTGKLHIIHSFTGGSDGWYPQSNLVDVSGTLYGTVSYGELGTCPPLGCGGIYAIDSSGNEKIVWRFGGSSGDGVHPSGPLAVINGIVYGTTQEGGSSACRFGRGCGTIFAFDPVSGVEAPAYSLKSADGSDPQGVVAANGVLYGMTFKAGGYKGGTVFSLVP